MSRILLETSIAAPAETCMELSLNVDVHLSVPEARERVVDGVSSGVMALGDRVTWESRRFGLKVRMTSEITDLASPNGFVDEMRRGPFARWRHVHRFEVRESGTLMVDDVDYRLPLGPFGWLADRLFIHRYMTKLLRSQNDHIRKLAENRGE